MLTSPAALPARARSVSPGVLAKFQRGNLPLPLGSCSISPALLAARARLHPHSSPCAVVLCPEKNALIFFVFVLFFSFSLVSELVLLGVWKHAPLLSCYQPFVELPPCAPRAASYHSDAKSPANSHLQGRNPEQDRQPCCTLPRSGHLEPRNCPG